MGKEPACKAGDTRDMASVSWSGRSPGAGHSNCLQYSCLETLMDRGSWRATVHRLQSDTPEVTEHSTAPYGDFTSF